MIPDNVTLIVKAPNQQIDDQNIECQSSWTVKQLKGHLSEVYPSKPSTDEQKIIYSGQLLDDNTILKDVLRTYDSHIIHTMHLVCTPKRRMPEPKTETPKVTDGLRQRNVPPSTTESTDRPAETPRAETRQNDQNHTVEMQNYLSSFGNNYGRVPPYPANYSFAQGYLPVPNDPESLATHMMMMQQAYMQYMQQYANMWQGHAVAPPTPEAPPQAPPPAPAQAEDEENLARDWLDHLYAASRLAILFSLVYLYGSPARLLLVLFIAAAGYLHQIGFFRDLQVHQHQANQPQPVADIPNRQPDNPERQPDNSDRPADNPERPAENSGRPIDNVQATDNDNQQSLLAVTWMIFTSFFASLIPETN